MAESSKKKSGVAGASAGTGSKPQILRVSTIIKKNESDSVTAAAVMTANRLKPTSRIEPAKFLKMVEQFTIRTIKKSGRR